MDMREIRELIQILDETDIAEFQLESQGLRLIIRKAGVLVDAGRSEAPAPEAGGGRPAAARTAAPEGAPPSPVADAAGPAPEARGAAPAGGERVVTVTAPMVGTFYRAPAPDAEPYVEEGDLVEAGQPLCIIEAMKLMNEIESEWRGRITEILVENAQPVEYGQPLFVLEKM